MTFYKPISDQPSTVLQSFRTCRFVMLLSVMGLYLSVSAAQAQCVISQDASHYESRKQQAILLMQYGDIILRATDGKIRCEEDTDAARQACQIDGPGEILVDADSGLFVITAQGTSPHMVHIYASGDVSCGLASELK